MVFRAPHREWHMCCNFHHRLRLRLRYYQVSFWKVSCSDFCLFLHLVEEQNSYLRTNQKFNEIVNLIYISILNLCINVFTHVYTYFAHF